MTRPALLALAAILTVAACGDAPPAARRTGTGDTPLAAPPAPRAELLLEAGDSSYWVQSGPDGVRLRGSPVLLARLDGRFHELYVVDDDHSFYDAVFVGQRLWRRDLLSGDSVALLEDTLVESAAERWARRHPDAEPLGPDEEESEEPSTVATGEIEVLDVLGPWVSVALHTDIDVSGEPHQHALRRLVIDLRTGRAATLAALVGPAAARGAIAEARRRYEAALDSVRQARDERGRRAARALAGFPFDSTSFGLTARDGAPAVAFVVPGRGDDAGGLALPLAPVVVAPPAWWRDVGAALPRTVADSVDRWTVGALAVDAEWSRDGTRIRLVLRDSTGRQWTVGRIQPPPRWLLRLDDPPLDTATRRALARAFDESALYSDEARTVALPHSRAGLVPVAGRARRVLPPASARGRARAHASTFVAP